MIKLNHSVIFSCWNAAQIVIAAAKIALLSEETHIYKFPVKIDKAVAALGLLLLTLLVLDISQLAATVRFAVRALAHTAPFITFAVLAVAYLKASGAENLLARAFEGRQVRMIGLAALLGGLSPFCSC